MLSHDKTKKVSEYDQEIQQSHTAYQSMRKSHRTLTVIRHVSKAARSRGYKTFSCPTQLSRKFQLLTKTKKRKGKKFLAFSFSGLVIIMLINVKMPIIVGILTFMSRMNFMLS